MLANPNYDEVVHSSKMCTEGLEQKLLQLHMKINLVAVGLH